MDLNNMKEAIDYVSKENKRLRDHFGFKDKEEAIYPQMLKLTEEVGELSEAVLQRNSLQRASKMDSKKTDVGSELADVLFVTLLLADNMNIDIVEEVRKKSEEVRNRKY